ncbi:hypothetical protein PILCRDRAFT_701909 [Piloderma croceum F 1598]|uniref:Uncharacterized protein n=1 Tax=Piloderma croceum (strain F 1598) TaxID=765440 RepID=A0A0C3BBB9_PILCF|nr:hypothetical protein PILCRDRAFT_701909 [Piloderma croceum F 1598]
MTNLLNLNSRAPSHCQPKIADTVVSLQARVVIVAYINPLILTTYYLCPDLLLQHFPLARRSDMLSPARKVRQLVTFVIYTVRGS